MSNSENFEGIFAWVKSNEEDFFSLPTTSSDYFLVKKAVIITFKRRHAVFSSGSGGSDSSFAKYVAPMNAVLEIIESTRCALS